MEGQEERKSLGRMKEGKREGGRSRRQAVGCCNGRRQEGSGRMLLGYEVGGKGKDDARA